MLASLAFLSLTEIAGPTPHRLHNEWEQLTYHPQMLLLPGVGWGDRWVRSPDCAAATLPGGEPAYAGIHYAGMYWLRPPIARSLREFSEVSERAFQIGQRPDQASTKHPLRQPFVPLKGYVNPRVLLSAEALPFRPIKGVFLGLSRFTRHDADAEAAFRWYDTVRIPDLLTCRGVAGAWVFVTRDLFRPQRDLAAPALRLQLLYLDGDPLDFMADLAARAPAWRSAGRWHDTAGIEEQLFAGPLRAIVPWRWDWFENEAAG